MEDIRTMLDRVASGELSVDQAVLELKKEPFSEAGFDELGFAKLDTHRFTEREKRRSRSLGSWRR